MRTVPVILSCLLLAAHLLRSGHLLPFLLVLAAPLLLLMRRPAADRSLQVLLGLAALEWLRTAAVLGMDRLAAGAPAGRMLLILGGVALFTAWSALPRRARATGVQRTAPRFERGSGSPPAAGAAGTPGRS